MAYPPGVQTESVYSYLKPHVEFNNRGLRHGFGLLITSGTARGASIGTSFLVRARVSADTELAYLYEFVNDPEITRVDTSGYLVRSSYNVDANVVSASVIFRYGPQDSVPAPKDGKDTKDRSK